MISCLSFYLICAYLSIAFGDPLVSFGGKHVIVAGDFGQLPPPGAGHLALYSDSVGAWSSSLSLKGQMNVIGQALWHQFTTVVILRQNMRQSGLNDGDKRYRKALENARMKDCDSHDIALFRSRIVGVSSKSPALHPPGSEPVSVITALNSHRDAVNEVGSQLLSQSLGLELEEFYSLDSWAPDKTESSVRATQRAQDRSINPVRSTNNVGVHMQELLWSLSPCFTDHQAGVLRLCRGLPVLLKNNEATELCATNGAEAVVVGWDFHVRTDGHKVLDTLFVKLHNPPQPVQLSGLPPNVIPLARFKQRIECKLPFGDRPTAYIQREQVMILPNFAMTDFASQGRTRAFNPVHLSHCRTAQSLYTCLSRSSSLAGLVILEGFNARKLTGGLPTPLKR
ncbi:uncharacterized protein TRAVEDRAFT_132365, partial [Trametes versicolor FP-101664 SS1]|uniref:uncharacterized protein n=1 Tax=Trametes versicolor (strain FP-101664) TaxID=717944 RepID=UPI0004621552